LKKVIIYGIGVIAKIVTNFLNLNDIEVEAYTVDDDYFEDSEFLGKPVVPLSIVEKRYPPEQYDGFVAVGYKRMRARKEMFEKMVSKGYFLINCVAKGAILLPNVEIGKNNLIFPGTVIENNVKIGDNNIIWSNATICHDSQIDNHNFIAAGVVIGGFCKIGNMNFIGFNSTIREKRIIPDEVLIGASSFVNKNPESLSVYYGVPAKKVKSLVNGVEIND